MQTWIPLESNPEVLNKFAHELGLAKEWAFCDVYGLEPDLLQMVPQPVLAVLLLFPITEKYEKYVGEESNRLDTDGQMTSDQIFFVKQTIHNACGTIAMVHAVCNNTDRVNIGDGFFQNFMSNSAAKSADERATLLEEDKELSQTHETVAQQGQTDVPPPEEDINLHFICFVEKDGQLYELDGRKKQPIHHGPTSRYTLLEDTATVVRKFMDRDPDNLRFTVMALTTATGDEQE